MVHVSVGSLARTHARTHARTLAREPLRRRKPQSAIVVFQNGLKMSSKCPPNVFDWSFPPSPQAGLKSRRHTGAALLPQRLHQPDDVKAEVANPCTQAPALLLVHCSHDPPVCTLIDRWTRPEDHVIRLPGPPAATGSSSAATGSSSSWYDHENRTWRSL